VRARDHVVLEALPRLHDLRTEKNVRIGDVLPGKGDLHCQNRCKVNEREMGGELPHQIDLASLWVHPHQHHLQDQILQEQLVRQTHLKNYCEQRIDLLPHPETGRLQDLQHDRLGETGHHEHFFGYGRGVRRCHQGQDLPEELHLQELGEEVRDHLQRARAGDGQGRGAVFLAGSQQHQRDLDQILNHQGRHLPGGQAVARHHQGRVRSSCRKRSQMDPGLLHAAHREKVIF
jgi:hypothetical protein